MFLCPEIFKTGTARPIYVVLRNHPLLYHLFKVAVDSRCPNRNPLPFKKTTDICNRYMCPFYGLQIGQDLFHLLCLIRRFCSHNIFLPPEFPANKSTFYTLYKLKTVFIL